MMKQFILSIILIQSLSACVPKLGTMQEFEEGRKGIVIFNVVSEEKGNLKSAYFSLNKLSVSDAGANDITSYVRPDSNYDINYSKHIIILEPGIHYINRVAYSDSLSYVPMDNPGYVNGKIRYGAFNVSPGEVLALGTLKIKSFEKFESFKNDYEKIKQDLDLMGYDNLTAKMKPGVFYEAEGFLKVKDGQPVYVPKTLINKFGRAVNKYLINQHKDELT